MCVPYQPKLSAMIVSEERICVCLFEGCCLRTHLQEAQNRCTEATCCKLSSSGVCWNAGLKAQLEQLSQQLYQSSGSSIERKNAELQQKVHDLQETVSQLTAQHSAQPGAREAELEQASNEKLSALKSQESQQLLHLKAQHDVLTDQLTKRVQELEAGEEDSKHEHQNELSMLESGKEQLIAELNSKHTSLVDQLTQQAEKLEVDLREAHNVSKDAAGKHANELRALLEQKQQLEADVQEAQEGSKITEGKLYDAEVGLVEAEEKLSETEQKLKQFEQRASKTAKTIRVRSASPLS